MAITHDALGPSDVNPIITLDAQSDLDEALVARANEARQRWQERAPARAKREEAIERGALLEVDSADRLAARVNRLIGEVRRESRDRRAPRNARLRTLVEHPALTAADLSDSIVKEALIEARDFLSVEFLERGIAVAQSVGCVMRRRGARFVPRGTGFLVGPGLLLTNEHVLPSRELAAECVVAMDYEQNAYGPPKVLRRFALLPQRFFLNDKKLDFALVFVAPRDLDGAGGIEQYGWLPLDAQQGKISMTPEDMINVIQHPLGREKEIVIRNNRVVDLRTGPEDQVMGAFLHYEADTEKGSSGSPVLNDQWEVVALHHSGVPAYDDAGRILRKDGGVWQKEDDAIETIAWVANEGIRVSSIIAHIEAAEVSGQERALLDTLLSAQAPGVFAVQSVAEEEGKIKRLASSTQPSESGEEGAARSDGQRSRQELQRGVELGNGSRATGSARGGQQRTEQAAIEVPLRISVELGGLGRGAAERGSRSPLRGGGQAEIVVERLEPEDYRGRKGFDADFLGTPIPLPRIKDRPRFGGPAPVSGSAKAFELKYHHFSVIMNRRRRLAYVSAVNIDFRAPVRVSRDDGSNTWRYDPRLDDALQADNVYYANNDYDRGHLTRRQDAGWGRTRREALAANNDSFHWTNAAPQHKFFNQSDDFTHRNLQLWGDLENHISAQGERERTRLCVFNGPIFSAEDRRYKDILVPKEYFKIVVFKDRRSERASAVGFVLSQADLIEDLEEEAFEAGAFALRQQRIFTIAKRVDLDLGYLVELDRLLPADAAEEALESADDGKLIEELYDIVL